MRRLAWLPFVALLGCGTAAAPTTTPAPAPAFSPTSTQVRLCAELAGQRKGEIDGGRYHPPEILVHRAPGDPQTAATRRMSEVDFHAMLNNEQAQTTLVIARGGTGKSKLAWSIEASLCATTPTARVDLQWDVAEADAPAAGVNPVLAAAAKRFGAPETDEPQEWLSKTLTGRPWLLLLDSLDEVSLQRRMGIVDAINAAQDRFPRMRVLVLTRPPVFSGTYGLRKVDLLAELPQLDCARTDAAMAELVPDAERRAALRALLTRYGLDRKQTTPDGRCYYPHLSTYRDFFVAERIAQNFAAAGGQQAATLEPSRARVYEFYLEVLLIKDLQGTSMTPAAALQIVDRIVAASKPGAGDRNISFRVADCLQQAPGGDEAAKKAICERLLQSSLFETAPRGEAEWKLKNQSIYDLFLARYTNAEILAAASSPCSVIGQRSALFESNEVAGFLVGMPGGQRCLVSIIHQLCRASGFAQHTFEQLDQGLPAGPDRKRLLTEAAADAKDAVAPQLCVGSTLERLVGRGAKAAPTDIEAPPQPGQ